MSDSNNQKLDSEPSSKKNKIDHENDNGVNDNQLELKDFELEKILNNNTVRKTVCVQGKFKDKSGVALIVLEKNAFTEEVLDNEGYFSVDTELKTFFQNDIYGNYECFPRPSLNGPLHAFPNPNSESWDVLEKFKIWKRILPESVQKRGDSYIYNCVRLCNNHFLETYCLPSHRLTMNAVPTLRLEPQDQTTEENLVQSINFKLDRNQSSVALKEPHGQFNEELFNISGYTSEPKDQPMEEEVVQPINFKLDRNQSLVALTEPLGQFNEELFNISGYTSESQDEPTEKDLVEPINFKLDRDQSSVALTKPLGQFNEELFNTSGCAYGVKTSIIYPATEKHIAKFSQQESHIVLETPQLYEKLTLPHITKEQFNLQWVYNILEGKSEQDRVIYDNKCERDGFVLLPDLKWDGVTKETLYLLAIVRRRGIKSLRDLDESTLPLLKRIRDEGKKKIYEKYKVPAAQLRVYLHYQPSFYHLHVHFTYLRHEAPGIYAEKSHLLDTVIDNIEMIGDYYKKATLPFTIREMDNIFNIYETNGHVQRIKPNIENIELIDK